MTDPSTCTHPDAHVHGLIGEGSRPIPAEQSRLDLAPLEWGRLDGPLREGERMSAAIGACADCGTLVVSVSTWNPADGRGENTRTYQTPWVAMYAVGGEYLAPVPAEAADRPTDTPAIRGRAGSTRPPATAVVRGPSHG